MSQAAKVQEPSMEEILASIRRIIADDDGAKPVVKSAAPAATIAAAVSPPQAAALPVPSAAPPAAATPAAPPPDLAAVPSSAPRQSDIDNAILDAAVAAEPQVDKDILDLTESMAASGSSAPNFQTIDGQSDIIFTEPSAVPEPRVPEPRAPEPPPVAAEEQSVAAPVTPPPSAPSPSSIPPAALLSGSTVAAVDSAFNSLAQTVLVHNARTLEDLVREMLRPLLKSWLDDNLPSIVERMVRLEIERVSRGRT